MTRTAIYPGTFNPPTIAHLSISEAVREQRQVDHVVWSISSVVLGKEHLEQSGLETRLAVVAEVTRRIAWLDYQVTHHQLMADIARGFDVLVLGADKWEQIQELRWYGNDAESRDRAMAQLPELAVAPRPPHEVPEGLGLQVRGMGEVSSSAARSGAHHQMLPEALASGHWTTQA